MVLEQQAARGNGTDGDHPGTSLEFVWSLQSVLRVAPGFEIYRLGADMSVIYHLGDEMMGPVGSTISTEISRATS